MINSEMMMTPADILKAPYARVVVPQPDGLFKAEILEFPGCFAVGATQVEALEALEETAFDWIRVTLEQGQDIPSPTDNASFSGKTALRMSKTLHKKAAQAALRDGVSLNQFIVNCIAEQVGMRAKPALVASSVMPLQVVMTLQAGFPVPALTDQRGTATKTATSIGSVTFPLPKEDVYA